MYKSYWSIRVHTGDSASAMLHVQYVRREEETGAFRKGTFILQKPFTFMVGADQHNVVSHTV